MGSSLTPAIPMPATIEPMNAHEAAAKFASLLDVGDDTPEEAASEPTESEAPAEDEVTDASAAPEQETDAEAESDDAEASEAVPATPSTYKVTVDGVEQEVPLDELLKGYSRTADYTRKTQQLAAERKSSEAELAAVRAERERYANTLGKLEEFLVSSTPQEPDWVTLQKEKPEEFPAEFAAWQTRKAQLERVQAEKLAADAKVQSDREAELKKLVEREHDLALDAIPEWKDEAKREAEKAALVEFAKGHGFTVDELKAVVDHRVLVLLRKAMLHDKAAKSVSQPVTRKAAPVLKPGAVEPAKKPVTDLTRARQRLAQTGDIYDAADVFLRAGLVDRDGSAPA